MGLALIPATVLGIAGPFVVLRLSRFAVRYRSKPNLGFHRPWQLARLVAKAVTLVTLAVGEP